MTLLEGDETAVLTFSPDAVYSVGAPLSAHRDDSADDEIAPVATATAADPTADEQGPPRPTAGCSFSFARTGSTTSPLTVRCAVTGTAANGVDDVAIPANITFRRRPGDRGSDDHTESSMGRAAEKPVKR